MVQLVVLAAASDPRPSANDVVAGWVGFAVFAFLILAVAFLGWSFSRQLKKVRAAKEAGLYDQSPEGRARNGAPQDNGQTPPTHHRA
jgi:hypothetical protein